MEFNYCFGCMEYLEPGERYCPYCGYDNAYVQNDETLLPEGSILHGKYLLGRKLGKGGFGITYLGIDVNYGWKVAIKEYFPSSLGSSRSYSRRVVVSDNYGSLESFRKGLIEFRKEAQALSMFDSPSIARVYDFFYENDTAYIVMDYVDGIGLNEEVERNGRLPWQRVVLLMLGLLPELDVLHRYNLIHRDIKPENLKIVPTEDGGERLVLLDFGSARSFISAELTGDYTMMLTPGYAPFEQYQKKSHQGPYTDIYGLCATMYNAITGVVPPAATDLIGGSEEIRPFSYYYVNVPPEVEKAIRHGMSFFSKERPQTLESFYNELVDAYNRNRQDSSYREDIYRKAKKLMRSDAAESQKEAAALFRQIPGYRDADNLRYKCEKRISGGSGISPILRNYLIFLAVLFVSAAGLIIFTQSRFDSSGNRGPAEIAVQPTGYISRTAVPTKTPVPTGTPRMIATSEPVITATKTPVKTATPASKISTDYYDVVFPVVIWNSKSETYRTVSGTTYKTSNLGQNEIYAVRFGLTNKTNKARTPSLKITLNGVNYSWNALEIKAKDSHGFVADSGYTGKGTYTWVFYIDGQEAARGSYTIS